MFQKLRLRLTLINAAIMLTLFISLIGGAYLFSQEALARRSEHVSRKLLMVIQDGSVDDIPYHEKIPFPPPPGLPPGPLGPPGPPGPPGPNFFFVKTAPDGSITFQSSGQPLNAGDLAALTEKALAAQPSQGTLSFDQTEYSYVRTPLSQQPGALVLFHDLSQEAAMLRVMLTALLAVGIVCSLLSFAASFFLANRAMVPIQTAWRQQKEFLSDASHELRTPLTVIQTNLDIVKGNQHETVASQNKWLANIQEETQCMAQLINSLLFLARADSQQQPLSIMAFSLNNALVRAASPFEPLAAVKGLALEIASGTPVRGCGDEGRLKQAIAILLDNAIRHTPAGGKIVVSLSAADNKAVLTVADTGEGIAAEYHDKIFDRFFQVDKSRAKGGAGLGLAIAKWIVESHGGVIAVASTPGTGTTFTVKLPLK